MKIARALILSSLLAFIVAPTQAENFGSGANSFDIQFVTIGNPGNPADTDDGDEFQSGIQNLGFVSYTFRIGKFEISEQMITKANSLGGLGITHDGRGADKPATTVSWNEAARFINWLNTSVGSLPAYKFALQPGEVGYSANANIELWTPGDAGYDPNNLYRNSQAKYYLPSANEWYKAAYFDPMAGVYCNYPTGSNSAPTVVASGTAAGTAIYNQSFATGPANVTLAGGLSPYGTMGQGGNAFEWEETDYDLVNGPANSSERGIRGGSWVSGFATYMRSAGRAFIRGTNIESVFDGYGFRVASTTEPSTGDFDADVDVDGRDFLVWQRDPGVGDLADWQANYGTSTLSALEATNVPEPGTVLSVVIGLFCLIPRGLRYHRVAFTRETILS